MLFRPRPKAAYSESNTSANKLLYYRSTEILTTQLTTRTEITDYLTLLSMFRTISWPAGLWAYARHLAFPPILLSLPFLYLSFASFAS